MSEDPPYYGSAFAATGAARPFRVLGIQQVAIGGLDKQRLRTLWVDKLGLEVTGHFRSERENVDEDICAMSRGANRVEVDLMQPLDPEKKPAASARALRATTSASCTRRATTSSRSAVKAC